MPQVDCRRDVDRVVFPVEGIFRDIYRHTSNASEVAEKEMQEKLRSLRHPWRCLFRNTVEWVGRLR
jgi:hypothetical protein